MKHRRRIGITPGIFQDHVPDSSCADFMRSGRKSDRGIVAKIAVCDGCLQYAEDCECCPECRLSTGHEHGCQNAATKRESIVVVRRKTMSGLGDEMPRTIRSPSIVIRVDDANGAESTGQSPAIRHQTMRSRER